MGPHSAFLGLGLDVVASHGLIVGPRGSPLTVAYRTVGRVEAVGGGPVDLHDLETGRCGVRVEHGSHGDSGGLGAGQPPVGGEGYGLAGVGASDGAGPDVRVNAPGCLLGKKRSEPLPEPVDELGSPLADILAEHGSEAERIVECTSQDRPGHRIQFVRTSGEAVPDCLERNGSTTRERIQHRKPFPSPRVPEELSESLLLLRSGTERERALVRVGRFLQLDSAFLGPENLLASFHGIAVDLAELHEPLVVFILGTEGPIVPSESLDVVSPRRKDTREHRGTARQQWPSRPPNMEEVEGRKRAGCTPLPHGLTPDRLDGEPVLYQSSESPAHCVLIPFPPSLASGPRTGLAASRAVSAGLRRSSTGSELADAKRVSCLGKDVGQC